MLIASLYDPIVVKTWENPDETDPHTGEKGDNDPLDICELGQRVCFVIRTLLTVS